MSGKVVNSRRIWTLLLVVICFMAMTVSVRVEAKSSSTMKLNKTQVTTYLAKKSTQLKVKNLKEGKTVTWKSSNPSVATVDENGKVTYLKKGNTIITAKVGKKSFKCIISITSKKAYNAVQQAKKYYNARNMSYSQSNRMGKTSADCSSFCGRCYLTQGMTLGGTTSWCNTAAGMAYWATKHNKVVANSGISVSSLKLRPGDLIFYTKGYNGRYKNIYHVEIFVGYGWSNGKLVGYTMSSITGHYPSILKRDYASRQKYVSEIARPAK
ncbi:MAG: Ig-like domain-containing protein [Clostridiales bacterium]|nr:Ig-like domain-containing protein [Clostridiales bacterium]